MSIENLPPEMQERIQGIINQAQQQPSTSSLPLLLLNLRR